MIKWEVAEEMREYIAEDTQIAISVIEEEHEAPESIIKAHIAHCMSTVLKAHDIDIDELNTLVTKLLDTCTTTYACIPHTIQCLHAVDRAFSKYITNNTEITLFPEENT